ncbi:MAG TPA: DUF4286 family protein [Hanamia sp.]|nr:DUF4286 family protein [Hanamia sp.]
MFIYNVTTKVDHSICKEWQQWQKDIHIPEIMKSELFYEHRFYQLLEHDDEEGKTFVTQFLTHSKSDYEKYLHQFAPDLRKKSLERWGAKVISFRSLLKSVQ